MHAFMILLKYILGEIQRVNKNFIRRTMIQPKLLLINLIHLTVSITFKVLNSGRKLMDEDQIEKYLGTHPSLKKI